MPFVFLGERLVLDGVRSVAKRADEGEVFSVLHRLAEKFDPVPTHGCGTKARGDGIAERQHHAGGPGGGGTWVVAGASIGRDRGGIQAAGIDSRSTGGPPCGPPGGLGSPSVNDTTRGKSAALPTISPGRGSATTRATTGAG